MSKHLIVLGHQQAQWWLQKSGMMFVMYFSSQWLNYILLEHSIQLKKNWGKFWDTVSVNSWNIYICICSFCCHFHPRPVLAFGYCHCLRLSMCVSMYVCVIPDFGACWYNNWSPVQTRITKFGIEVQNTLVKIPIVLWVIDLDIQGQI